MVNDGPSCPRAKGKYNTANGSGLSVLSWNPGPLAVCECLPGSLEDLSCAGSTGRGDKVSVRMTRGQ